MGCNPPIKGVDGAEALSAMPAFSGAASTSCVSESGRAELSGVTIDEAAIDVSGATVDPGSSLSNVALAHAGNSVGATLVAPRDGYLGGGWTHSVTATDADAGSMFNCGPLSSGDTSPEACSGRYRVTVAPPPSGLVSCSDLGTPSMALSGSYSTAVMLRPEAECTSGSGRFMLYPWVFGDRDGDGRASVIFRGIQVSGTGVMTSTSSIASITVVDHPGYPIRVIRSDTTYRIDASDQLVAAEENSIELSGATVLEPGTVRGHADFVVVEPEGDDMSGYALDLTWVCDGGGSPKPAAVGYQFTLADIGVDSPQRVVLRPRFNVTPKRIEWELYGDPRATVTIPVENTVEGYAFAYESGGILVDGVVLATSSQAATVRLDQLEWNGIPVGTPGTYVLAGE